MTEIRKGVGPGWLQAHSAPHPPYRIYLRGPSDNIVGREDFEAEGDEAAMVLARLLYQACNDVAQRFELWQGGRQVDAGSDATTALDALTTRIEDEATQLEERLRDSHWAIARSETLLERLKQRDRQK